MLAWEHKSTQVDKAENKGLGRGTVTQKCFVFQPLTDVPIPSWALRHESITTLSAGHLCMSHLPGAPSIHYSDGHVSGDEEKSSDLQQSFAASHLGSWTGSCKKRDRQSLSSLGGRQTSSYRSAVTLTELTVSSFLPQRSRSLRLPGVKTFHFRTVFLLSMLAVWSEGSFVFHWFVEKENHHRETSVTISAIIQYKPTPLFLI